MRLTSRDQDILSLLSFNAYSLSILALLFFSSKKKAAQRMRMLFDARLVFRAQRPFLGGRGKAEYVYTAKPIKSVYSIPHSLIIGDVHVAMTVVQANGFLVEFFYPGSIGLMPNVLNGLIPDAVAVIKEVQSGKKLLHFIEADTGSESVSAKRSHYSLEKKFEKYLSLLRRRRGARTRRTPRPCFGKSPSCRVSFLQKTPQRAL